MPCTEVTSKKYQTRKSPSFHAGDCKGQTKKGKDGTYVSQADKRGVYKWIKANKTQKNSGKAYLTHDNGATPFRVSVSGNRVQIVVNETNKPVKSYKVKDIYYGISKGDQKTKGNSLVLHLGGNKYVHIGTEVYEFEMDDVVDKYYSLIGNNDVPYPILVGTDNVYFMLDHTYVPKSLFGLKMTPSMWADAYTYYYGWTDPQTGKKHGDAEQKACGCALEDKAKKMKKFRMVKRKVF